MKAIYLIAPLLLVCMACKPTIITVPCPKPPAVVRPNLRVKELSQDATMQDILKAYVLDLADQVGYSNELEAILNGYR
jgi:hypothetical protein